MPSGMQFIAELMPDGFVYVFAHSCVGWAVKQPHLPAVADSPKGRK